MFLLCRGRVSAAPREVTEVSIKLYARGVRLESFVESEDLARRRRGHGGADERVPKAVLSNLLLERRPVPEVGRRNVPEVVLEQTVTGRRSALLEVRRVGSRLAGMFGGPFACHVAGRLDRCMVNCLEDLEVQLASLRRIERQAKGHEGVGEALHTDADRAVTHVAPLGLLDGVVVDIDDAVEVVSDDLHDVVQFLEVVLSVLDKGR